jgi:hypothetical protein
MTDADLTLRPGMTLTDHDAAKIASAFKALAVYDSMAHDHAEDPEELLDMVEEGLEVVNRTFR